jgi:autotransporter-associated beta strand protein
MAGGANIRNENANAAYTLNFSATNFNQTAGGLVNTLRTLTFGGINTGNNTVAGIITNNNASAAIAVAKADAGTWILSGANLYTGGTTISGGTLQFAKTNSMPATGTVTVGTGTTLAVNAGGTGEFTSATNGAGSIGGLLAGLGGRGAAVNYTGNVSLGIDTANASGGTMTYAGSITNVGTTLALRKLGANTLVLDGNNTYTGGTTISAGTLELVNGGSVAGNITNNATLSINRTDSSTLANAVSGSGALTKSGSGTATLTAANTYSGGTTISAGTLELGNGGSVAGNITNNATLSINRTDSSTLANAVSGSGALTKSGSGTATLTAANTYSGNTTVSEGALQLATNGSLRFVIGGSGTNNSVNGTGTTTMNGQFNFDLAGASTNTNSTWTIVANTLSKSYGTNFLVNGFTNSGGTWTRGTNGVTYQFVQSTGVLSVVGSAPVSAYNSWLANYPGLGVSTNGTADPDNDGLNNNMEFAFDGDPTVGSPALISVASSAAGPVFSFLARRDTGAVSYVVESTSDLSTVPWTDNNVVTASIRESSNQANVPLASSYVRLEFTVTSAGGKSFYRVRATIP